MTSGLRWHIITGEYAQGSGGVADYTRTMAAALARAGDEVDVWAPSARTGDLQADPGVRVHPLPDVFGPRSLARLTRVFGKSGSPARILVQYVPHAFGMRGMNLTFASWIATAIPSNHEVWVMFHEVYTPWVAHPLKHNVQAIATRAMAGLVVRRADRILISTLGWNRYMRYLRPRASTTTWLPVPSNLPTEVLDADVAELRRTLGAERGPVLGHFGTYGSHVEPYLYGTISELLRSAPSARVFLLGRGGDEYAARLPVAMRERILAPGKLSPTMVATHLAACDVVIQPYVDGVSGRRTTTMASLSLGVPVVTNEGRMTEHIWRESGAVALGADQKALAPLASTLLDDAGARRALGERGRELYRARFSLERMIRVLREPDE